MTHYQTAMVDIPLMVREPGIRRIRNPADVSVMCRDLADLMQESFQILTLDGKQNLIARHMVTLGLIDASLVHPREVFRRAILDGALNIVLVHNHPSGDPTPSAEDVRVTRQLIQAGRIINIGVRDHVIIGRVQQADTKDYLSMRESGLCDFDGVLEVTGGSEVT